MSWASRAFGSASWGGGGGGQATLAPAAFSNVSLFGVAVVTAASFLAPAAYANPNTFGTPVVSATSTLAPTAYANPNTFGTPVVSGTYGLAPAAYTNPDSFGTPVVTPGAVGLSPAAYDDPDSFGTPVVSEGYVLTPAAYDDPDAFGTPVITGTYGLAPAAYDDPDSFGTPVVSGSYALEPAAYIDPDSFGTPVVAPGVVTLLPAAYYDPDSFGTPTVTPGAVGLLPAAYADPDTFGTPVVSGTYALGPAAYVDPDAFGTPVVSSTYGLAPTAYTDPDTFGTPVVTAGDVLLPASYVDPDSFGTPVVTSAKTLLPAAYADPDQFGTPVVAATNTLAPAAYVDPDTFGTPVVAITHVIAPAAYVDPDAFGTPTVSSTYGLAPTAYVDPDSFGTPVVLNLVPATHKVVIMPFRPQAFTLEPKWPIIPPSVLTQHAYASAAVFGVPVVTTHSSATTTAFVSQTFRAGSPTVFVGVNPTKFVDADAFGAPAVTGGDPDQPLYGRRLFETNLFGRPTVTRGGMLYPLSFDDRTPRTIQTLNGVYTTGGDIFGRPQVIMSGPAAILGLLSLVYTPVSFEPNPPGVSRPSTLSSGFSNGLALYQKGAGGPRRLLMQEAWGYSVLDLGAPSTPVALAYVDNRFETNHITTGGDGQSDVASMGVSDDGQRAAFSLSGPAESWYTIVGQAASEGFANRGSFSPHDAYATLMQHIGSRYIVWSFGPMGSSVRDVTTLPASGDWDKRNMAPSEATGFSGSTIAVLAGNYLVFKDGTSIRVVDVSQPGAVGHIATSLPQTTITPGDVGGDSLGNHTAMFDTVSNTLYVLVESGPNVRGPDHVSYRLVSFTPGLSKTVGQAWNIPIAAGEGYIPSGISSSLVRHGGGVFVLLWTYRQTTNGVDTQQFKLWSTTVSRWPVMAGSFEVAATGFVPGHQTASFSDGLNIYHYVPTTVSAYAFTLNCTP